MTSVQTQALELFVDSSLKSICASPVPFITVYLPAYRPGASELPMAPRLKAIIRDAAAELSRRRYLEPVADLLGPLEDLARDPAALTGTSASVIFRSPRNFSHFAIRGTVSERLVVATHPYITPLLLNRIKEREMYILALSTKHLRLARWRDGMCEEVPLPPSVPKRLSEAEAFDQPDHNQENRAPSGGAEGQMRGVRFGTSADADKADKYLFDYLKLVDRELSRVLGGAPLVLVGVAGELAAYRRAAEYPRLLDARHTSGEHLSARELGELAEESVSTAGRLEAEKLLGEILETVRRDRVASGVREVLQAAHEGRVHKLLIAEGAEHQELPGPLYSINETLLEGPQDLLNAAAVETIRAGGEAYTFDSLQRAGVGPIAAILRYTP